MRHVRRNAALSRILAPRRATAVALAAFLGGVACASPSPPLPPRPAPFDTVRRVAVVGQGQSAFKVVEYRPEPGQTFDDVAKWLPYPWLRSLGPLVHSGINWLLNLGRTASGALDAAGMAPSAIVAEAFVRRLQLAGSFETAEALTTEPVGEERRGLDGIVRVSVPTWGLMRVRQDPDRLSTFADVHAQMVIPETGVVVWEKSEDVTDPERFPWESIAGDRRLARQQLHEVLQQSGQRLASEFLYARGHAR